VHEPVPLGEPLVVPQRHPDLAPLDRAGLDAERPHHGRPAEAGLYPGQHLRGGFDS
jgi:hypothetical protein